MLREFQRYKELVKRRSLSKELITERYVWHWIVLMSQIATDREESTQYLLHCVSTLSTMANVTFLIQESCFAESHCSGR